MVNFLGIRYKLTEAALTKELMEKLDQEQENDYCDEPTKFVSEHHEQFQVPGFVHRPPPPTTVITTASALLTICLNLMHYIVLTETRCLFGDACLILD